MNNYNFTTFLVTPKRISLDQREQLGVEPCDARFCPQVVNLKLVLQIQKLVISAMSKKGYI